MGSHCGGRVPRHKASGGKTPYSPSLTGRLAANGHPTAGASLSPSHIGRANAKGEDRAASPKFKI
ncbi:hypothetical protein [Nostoc sp.]|uniref:hypothetical protein n=1 Tax=Nostoc sp. TaxID=1180 RepID=UPI002FF782E1